MLAEGGVHAPTAGGDHHPAARWSTAEYMELIVIKMADDDCSHPGPAGPPPIFNYQF